MKKNPTTTDRPQRDRFIETARKLGCDEDEARFNQTLKRIAPKREEDDQSRQSRRAR